MYFALLGPCLNVRRGPTFQTLPVAGDDATAKHQVMALVEELGIDAVDDGTLHQS